MAQNHTFTQMFSGKDVGQWDVHPTKIESHSSRSLQDFVRNAGILPILERDNARTQTREKWTSFERQSCVDGIMTEPKSPW